MTEDSVDYENKPIILIIGKNGQVGWELQRSLSPLGDLVCCDRKKLDMSDSENIRALVRDIKPDVIVNAAAYTAVDKAEEEVELATQINGVAPGVLADEARKINALLIHYSTDYVFNGASKSPYTETDIPDPINIYGESKLKGEFLIGQSNIDYVILRTSWVYASRGHNFLRSILRLAREREELNIVNDQIGSPTSARLIADVSAQIIWQSLSQRKNNTFKSGLYHLVSAGYVSWFGFASKIVEYAGKYIGEEHIELKRMLPIPTSEYPTPARRPLSSRLSTDKISTQFSIYMPNWEQQLKLCIQELKES